MTSCRYQWHVFAFVSLFVFSAVVIAQPSPSEVTRTLSAQEVIGGITLPAGSVVTSEEKGSVIEAVLHTTTHWGHAFLPANSRILYFKTQIWVLVPGTTESPSDWTTAPAGILPLLNDGPNDDYDVKQCFDHYPWLTMTGIGNAQAISIPPPEIPPLMTSSLTLQGSGAKPGPNVLSAPFHSENFDLPSGTIVVADDKAEQARAIYAIASARVDGNILPAYSFVQLFSEFRAIYVHQSIVVNGQTVRAGTGFVTDGHGALARFIAGETTKLTDHFTVAPGSVIGMVASRLFRVDLAQDATYDGIPVAGGTTVCFLPDGTANVLLQKDTVIGGKQFPAGSTVVVTPDGTQPEYAYLSKPMIFDGYPVKLVEPYRERVTFTADGHFKSGSVSAPVNVKGINVKGHIFLHEDRTLQSGTLDGDQVIYGVPCLGNKPVELNDSGEPILFTAAGGYTVGSTVLHRGDAFTGVYEKKDHITVLPTQCSPGKECLSGAIASIQQELITQFQNGVRQNSGKFPFGNIGNIQSKNFRWNGASDHIDLHQDIFVESMFTNPLFSDCDANVHIDITVKWVVTQSFGARQWILAWPASIGGGYSHGVCPGTAAIETVIAAASALFGHVRDLLDEKRQNAANQIEAAAQKYAIQKQIGDLALDKYRPLVQALEAGGEVLPGSIEIDSLYIDGDGLELGYVYRVLKK